MIHCPQCDIPMQEATARADPGTLIQLDQCRNCGGIWCDKWELFPVDPDEAERMDANEAVDAASLAASVELERSCLYCPRCTAALQHCKDPALPANLLLTRCSRCDGIWLNRGQMKRFKRHQRQTRLKKMDPGAVVPKLSEIYGNPAAWVVKGTQGMMAYPRMLEKPEDDLKSDQRGAVGTILQALVRLAIGV
jgi:Zn-finger nucleic acid-binding protein